MGRRGEDCTGRLALHFIGSIIQLSLPPEREEVLYNMRCFLGVSGIAMHDHNGTSNTHTLESVQNG